MNVFYIFDSKNYIEFVKNTNWKRTKHVNAIPIKR